MSNRVKIARAHLLSLKLWFDDESVPALWGNVEDGLMMVKFSRAALQDILWDRGGEEVEIWRAL